MIIILSIVLVVASVSILYAIQLPHYSLEIHGMKDVYNIEEDYSFYYTLSGFGNTCGVWMVTYPDKNGEIISVGEVVDCTLPTNKDLSVKSQKFNSVIPDIPGFYNVTVSIEKTKQPVVFEFEVLSNQTSGEIHELGSESNSEINRNCMTLKQSKDIAPFFKTPTYLPEGYSFTCSRSGTPFESYIVYYDKVFPNNWQIHELVSDGAIFIYQIDERNMVGDKEFQTYGSPEQRTRGTYDDVMKNNPSLNPQLITVNGMLAYAVDSCPDCGMQTANFADGTSIQESTSTKTRIKFIDDGVTYMLETTMPLQELIKIAESLQ